mgnify:CR=1 FL=1
MDDDINTRALNEEDTSSETGTEEEDISAADQCSAISDASITMGTTSETNIPAASAVTPDKRKTPITPRILFIKYVIHGMVLRMAFEHVSGEILFPISFKEFISQKCHEDILLFYQELTDLFEDAINDFFHPLVSPDQNIWKRKKKRKLNDERGKKRKKIRKKMILLPKVARVLFQVKQLQMVMEEQHLVEKSLLILLPKLVLPKIVGVTFQVKQLQ